jgi:hypothetical protein
VTVTGTAFNCVGSPGAGMSGVAPRSRAKTASKDDKSDNTSTAESKKKPPDGAVGFVFAHTPEEAGAICSGAGHQWGPSGENHFRCSGTPTAMGLPASALLRFCRGKLCAVMVTVQPASQGGAVWSKALLQIRTALVQKYGQPDDSRSSVPGDCAGEKLYGCLSQGRAQVVLEWAWPEGEKIKLRMAKPEDQTAPLGIRIIYSRREVEDAPALEGL